MVQSILKFRSNSFSRLLFGALFVSAFTGVFVATDAQAKKGYYLKHEMIFPNPMTGQESKHTVESWHQGNKYRRSNPMTNEAVVIDLDNQKVFGINDDAKTFWEIPMEQYRPMAMMPLMVMGVRPMPDGSIQIPEKMFKASGKAETIGSFKAYEVNVVSDLPPGMETAFWLSTDVKMPKKKLIDELRVSLANPGNKELEKLYTHWRNLDGYPVRTVTKMTTPRGNLSTQETLTHYESKRIPASTFIVPKGYKKTIDPLTRMRNMQMQMQQQRASGMGGGAPGGGLGNFQLTPPGSGGQKKRVLPRQ